MFSISRTQHLVADDLDCGHNQNGPEHDFQEFDGRGCDRHAAEH
jgi:hypothetical protein